MRLSMLAETELIKLSSIRYANQRGAKFPLILGGPFVRYNFFFYDLFRSVNSFKHTSPQAVQRLRRLFYASRPGPFHAPFANFALFGYDKKNDFRRKGGRKRCVWTASDCVIRGRLDFFFVRGEHNLIC